MKDEKNESEEICTPVEPEEATEEEILAYWTEERLKSAKPIPVPSPDIEAPAKSPEKATEPEDQT